MDHLRWEHDVAWWQEFAAPASCPGQCRGFDNFHQACKPTDSLMCVFVQVERGGHPGLPYELLHRAHLLLQHHPGQPVPCRPPLQGHVPAHRRHWGPAAAVRPQQATAQWSVPGERVGLIMGRGISLIHTSAIHIELNEKQRIQNRSFSFLL